MAPERKEPHPDDAGIEDLLREVGSRHEPSAEASARVEAALRVEWRAMLDRRRRTRRRVAGGVAAGIAVVASLVSVRQLDLRPADVATVARIDGHLLAGQQDDLRVRGSGVPVRRGETLQTDDRSRAALAMASGVSVRLDRDTTVSFASADHLTLRTGALYVDAPPHLTGAAPLIVHAQGGSVRHIGTQYQLRTHADDIAVSVREGRVLIEHGAGQSVGGAGERIRITRRGEITRTAISAQDASWSWAAQAAPQFDIDDQTLAAFLEWVARETGRRIAYASPQARTAARTLRLRGSIEGLDLETALSAVLSTTRLRRYETAPDAIGIDLPAANDPAAANRPTT